MEPPDQASPTVWARRLCWGAAAVAAVVVAGGLLRGPIPVMRALDWGSPFGDLGIYHAQAVRMWQAPVTLADHWAYPPLAAMFVAPLGLLSRDAAGGVWAGVQLLWVGAMVWGCRYILRPLGTRAAWAGAAGLVLASLPVWHCVRWGQISTLIVMLGMLGMCAPGWRGAVPLGLAVSLKLYPAAWLSESLARRDFGAFTRGLLVALSVGLFVPILVLGPEWTFALLERVVVVSLQIGAMDTASGPAGGTLRAAMVRWFHGGGELHFAAHPDPWLLALPPLAVEWLSRLSQLGIMVGTLWLAWRHPRRHVLTAALSITAWTLLLRPAWVHYFAGLPMAQAAVLAHGRLGRGPLWAVGVGFALSAGSCVAFLVNPFNYFVAVSAGVPTLSALATWLGAFWAGLRGLAVMDSTRLSGAIEA